MHKQAVRMVSAAAQAAMLATIEGEADRAGGRRLRRGRNAQAKHARAETRRSSGLRARHGAGGALGLSLCDQPDPTNRRADYPCDCTHGGNMATGKLKVILLLRLRPTRMSLSPGRAALLRQRGI